MRDFSCANLELFNSFIVKLKKKEKAFYEYKKKCQIPLSFGEKIFKIKMSRATSFSNVLFSFFITKVWNIDICVENWKLNKKKLVILTTWGHKTIQ